MTSDRNRYLVPFAILFAVLFFFALSLVSVLKTSPDGGVSVSGKSSGRIALVEIVGPIMDSKPVLDALDAAQYDDRTKAILVRVDSPGGAVGPSQEIYEAISRIKPAKPVVVSMGSVAASGGFYIASAGTQILANAGTLTGSIGVIMGFTDMSELLEWAKVDVEVIKTGRFKDTGANHRPITDVERDYLQSLANEILDQFVADVAKGRKAAGVDQADIRKVADGRVFTGAAAKKLKLVDQIGGYPAAVSVAARLGGIEGRPDVYKPKVGPPWIQRVLEQGVREEASTALSRHLLPLWLVWLP